ncbi:hypothetical protein F2Q69_00040744 [Brassica cretica]|uniref:Uncharacterized protein n=1 Tax=Brassica cretica TaxID=69181 RepID=A0A8S9NHP9_BRACR|nr:hypothetical protein F2Q69_00040744 [Brassica cretica]
MISWSPMSGLKLIEPVSFQLRQVYNWIDRFWRLDHNFIIPWPFLLILSFWKADKLLLTPMMGFDSVRSLLEVKSPSKVGYSQMDGLENL